MFLTLTHLPDASLKSFATVAWVRYRVAVLRICALQNGTCPKAKRLLTDCCLKHPDTRKAVRQIEESPQWVDQIEGDIPILIALSTAETYILAARVYYLIRLFGYSSPTV